jgi:hypothetical protein
MADPNNPAGIMLAQLGASMGGAYMFADALVLSCLCLSQTWGGRAQGAPLSHKNTVCQQQQQHQQHQQELTYLTTLSTRAHTGGADSSFSALVAAAVGMSALEGGGGGQVFGGGMEGVGGGGGGMGAYPIDPALLEVGVCA